VASRWHCVAVDSGGSAYVLDSLTRVTFRIGRVAADFGGGHMILCDEIESGGFDLDYSTYLGGGGIDSALALRWTPTITQSDGRDRFDNFPLQTHCNGPSAAACRSVYCRHQAGSHDQERRSQRQEITVSGSGFDSGARF